MALILSFIRRRNIWAVMAMCWAAWWRRRRSARTNCGYSSVRSVRTSARLKAWLTLRGLRTLALRLREQCANALGVAQWLHDQPSIARVVYPGLPDHPNHDLAQQLFRADYFGGMVSFELRDAAEPEVFRFMERLKLIQTATSLGDVYSLLLYPAASSHHALGREERLRQGIGDGLVRLSVGIEDVEDVIADLRQALYTP